MAQSTDKPMVPPYVPYKTFTAFLEGLRANVIPGQIDRSVMGSTAGSVQTWLLSSLRYLNLIDQADVPTDGLRRLVKAEGDERKTLLREMTKASYAFLFQNGADVHSLTPRQLDQKFEDTGASGETVRKCVSFFTALAKDADLKLSPYILKSTRTRKVTRTRRSAGSAEGDVDIEDGDDDKDTLSAPSVATMTKTLIDMLDPNSMDEAEQTAVWTLLKYLKKKPL